MADDTPFTIWLEIDLGAIKNNILRFKEITSRAVMAVVKANGYGHGAYQIGAAAAQAGAEWLGVARFEEALPLRDLGINLPILVMGYTQPIHVLQAVTKDISLAVSDQQTAEAYLVQARRIGKKIKVHVKVDTGMGRLGVFPQDSYQFLFWLNQQEWIKVEGLFTHFACSDEPVSPVTNQQIDEFKKLIVKLEIENIRPKWVHACNSAGIFNYPEAFFDMVRPGISLYGLNPSKKTKIAPGFLPALEWKTRLVSVKEFPPGKGISYSHIYTTREKEIIGAIPVGYADNFRRQNGNIALAGGKRVDVVGRVCMDQSMLQLSDVPGVKIGDEVVLIGRQGDQVITAEDVADIWQTINYEVVANLAGRLPRIYKNQ